MPRNRDQKHAAAVSLEGDDRAILRQVVDYYHATLKESPEALAYLKARHLDHSDLIDRFQLGYSNRTLGYSLPNKLTKAGAEIRGRLMHLGILRESGHEHFTGSLVVPVFDDDGSVVQLYGRKLLDNLRKGTPLHTYLPGPHRGVWNLDAFKESKELILAKGLVEALTFWSSGFRNVTAAYGPEGVTAEHLAAIKRFGTKRLLIAFDADEAGDAAAVALAEQLEGMGIASARIQFPKGADASSLRLRKLPAALGKLIADAVPMIQSIRPQVTVPAPLTVPQPAPDPLPVMAIPEPQKPETQPPAPVAPVPAVAPSDPPNTPPKPTDGIPTEIKGDDLMIDLGVRVYRVRGWQKPLNPESLKVNVMVTKGERFFVDSLDLYQAKARTAFIRQAAQELPAAEDVLKRDLGIVLRKVEAIQADLLSEALKPKDTRPQMSEQERADAMALLTDPNLTGRILQDFETLGVVGEESNKLTGYLAAVSRLLDRPLALLIQSASAAGKSSLMDAVLELVPEEDVVRYSAMTGQSLFYLGDRSLAHKVLAVAEEEGVRQASYALKLLQSDGKVSIASTGKNPTTGMLCTHEYTVSGPVMLFMTTTSAEVEEELQNRCTVLVADESREQTRAIHARQRTRETLEGLISRNQRDHLITVHRNAQRLLEPLSIVNPFAEQLRFRDYQIRSRRDHTKYLTLIRAITMLHQHQREIRTVDYQGAALRFVETTASDITLANDLFQEIQERTLGDLTPQTRKLLGLLHEWVRSECERLSLPQSDFRFTRRQLRGVLQWGDTQLKVHLARLVDLELLAVHSGEHRGVFAYELLYQGEDADGRARLLGLIDPTNLVPAGSAPSALPNVDTRAGSGRGLVGGRSVGGREDGLPSKPNGTGHSDVGAVSQLETAVPGVSPAPASYPGTRHESQAEVRR